jgi:hypothetical protein
MKLCSLPSIQNWRWGLSGNCRCNVDRRRESTLHADLQIRDAAAGIARFA